MSEGPVQTPSQSVLHASLSGDCEVIASLFSDDAVAMPPNDSTLFGKNEIRSWWQEYFQFFSVASSVETERDLTIAGSQAFDRSSFSVTIIPKKSGEAIHDDIRSLTVWSCAADGSWKISHQIWNSTKPVGSGTNRYMTRILQKKSDGR